MKQLLTHYKALVLALAIVFTGFFATLLPATTYAAGEVNKTQVCDSIGAGGDCNSAGGIKLNNVTAWVVNIISWGVGLLAVIMIIISGAKFITASGDSGKIASARTGLMWAIIGLIIAALAQVIVQFVLAKTTAPAPAKEEGEQQGRVLDREAARSVASSYYVLPG